MGCGSLRTVMAFEHEQRQALRALEGIEQGSMTTAQSFQALDEADPTLVYFIFSWLRAHYPPHHPAAEGVLGRLAAVCSEHPVLPRKAKEGQADPVVGWFEDAYAYRDVDSREFIALVVEKLEG